MREQYGWIEGNVHYRVPVEARDLAKVLPMAPSARPRNFVLKSLWALGLGVVASLIAWSIEAAAGTSGFLSGVAAAFARIVPWLTGFGAFFSTLGIIYAVRSICDFVRSRTETIDESLVEFDLASSSPVAAQLNLVTPQLQVHLTLVNHSDFDIRINPLTVKVSFGQTLIKLSNETHVDVSAHTTEREIPLMNTLDDSQKSQLTNFLSGADGAPRVVYVDVIAACEAGKAAFTLSQHFERHGPEVNSIAR